jgi:hypothetical protein
MFNVSSPYQVPKGYALISIEVLKAWGKLEEVQAACQYPVLDYDKLRKVLKERDANRTI